MKKQELINDLPDTFIFSFRLPWGIIPENVRSFPRKREKESVRRMSERVTPTELHNVFVGGYLRQLMSYGYVIADIHVVAESRRYGIFNVCLVKGGILAEELSFADKFVRELFSCFVWVNCKAFQNASNDSIRLSHRVGVKSFQDEITMLLPVPGEVEDVAIVD